MNVFRIQKITLRKGYWGDNYSELKWWLLTLFKKNNFDQFDSKISIASFCQWVCVSNKTENRWPSLCFPFSFSFPFLTLCSFLKNNVCFPCCHFTRPLEPASFGLRPAIPLIPTSSPSRKQLPHSQNALLDSHRLFNYGHNSFLPIPFKLRPDVYSWCLELIPAIWFLFSALLGRCFQSILALFDLTDATEITSRSVLFSYHPLPSWSLFLCCWKGSPCLASPLSTGTFYIII